MKIARIFPTKTSMSPQDRDAYFSTPELFMPEYDEVHISVTFIWDIEKGYWLKKQWEHIAPVKIGGVAINGEGGEFNPGMYIKRGATITSRGCPNNCPWCLVNGKLKELEIKPGRIICDNNLLACSESHISKVFKMLKNQKAIEFSGGLESKRITEKIVIELSKLSIRHIFLAYDKKSALKDLKKSGKILNKYFNRNQLRCYVLVGYKNDTIECAKARLIESWEAGFFPFCMLYRDEKEEYRNRNREWSQLQRIWTRPAITKAYVKNGFKDIAYT